MQLGSLDVSCPFLRGQKSEAAATKAPLSTAAARRAGDISTSEAIRLIVSKQLGLPNHNIDNYVAKLESELVCNAAVLFSLDPNILPRLGLPVALEDALAKMIRAHARNSAATSRRSSATTASISELQQKASALLSVKDEFRQAIIQTWSLLSTSQGKFANDKPREYMLSRFVERMFLLLNLGYLDLSTASNEPSSCPCSLLTKFLFEISPKMKSIFGSSNPLAQGSQLLRLVQLCAKAAEEPVSGILMLKKHAITHFILGLERSDYESISMSIVKALEQCLPSEDMNETVRGGWYACATATGEFLLACYEDIKAGTKFSGWKKSGTKWRSYPMRLTERKLLFLKETEEADNGVKPKEEIDLMLLEACEPLEDDSISKPTEFCINLDLKSGERILLCVASEEARQGLLDDLNRRVRAWEHWKAVHPEAACSVTPPPLSKTSRPGSGILNVGRRGSSANAPSKGGEQSSEEENSDEARSEKAAVSPRRIRVARQEAVFENILLDKELQTSFSKFLSDIQAKHIFDFYEQIETVWRKNNFLDTSAGYQQSLLQYAQSIFTTFLSLQSEKCLSIADDQRAIINRAIKSGRTPVSQKLFDQALNEVGHQLRGHFVTFKAQFKI